MDNLLGVAAFGEGGPSPFIRAVALETATLIGVFLIVFHGISAQWLIESVRGRRW